MTARCTVHLTYSFFGGAMGFTVLTRLLPAALLRIGSRALVLALSAILVAPATAGSLPETIARVKPGVVGVGTVQQTRRPPVKLLATGFVVADGSHVVTNAHAIPDELDWGSKEFLAVLTGERNGTAYPAKVVRVDKVHDLALLRFSGKPRLAFRLGSSENVREGELYAFTGFPIGMVLGMRPVTHRGIVSAITPIAIPQISPKLLNPKMIKQLRDPYDVFQLDATAYPGNSGSPLYDPETGEVVGVINKVFVKESKEAVLEKPSGITYAIPVRYVKELLRDAGLAQ
jgi:serine protease Do